MNIKCTCCLSSRLVVLTIIKLFSTSSSLLNRTLCLLHRRTKMAPMAPPIWTTRWRRYSRCRTETGCSCTGFTPVRNLRLNRSVPGIGSMRMTSTVSDRGQILFYQVLKLSLSTYSYTPCTYRSRVIDLF